MTRKNDDSQGVKLVTSINGIDLTRYLMTVGELFSFGMSTGDGDIDQEVTRIKEALEKLPVTARRDVYVTVITGAAGLYMAARKIPLWFIRYLALRRIVEGEVHYDSPHDSVLYDMDLGQIGRLGSIPRATAAVAIDTPKVIKALKSGGNKMPELSVDEVADGLTTDDVAQLLMALPQFARECSANS